MEDKDKLSGLNYLTWSYLMQMILIHADLWDIVRTPPAEMTPDLMKKSQKALALIVFNISTALIPVIRVCSTAAEAWAKLESMYAQKSQHRIQNLRDQLYSLVMGSSESMTAYFARARGIWNELQSLGHATTESDVVWSVLKGLPSRFSVIATILRSSSGTPALTLDSALGQLLTFEMSSTGNGSGGSGGSGDQPSSDGLVTAHVATSKPVCHYCKKPGHFIRECRRRIASEARRGQNPPHAHGQGQGQGNVAQVVTTTTVSDPTPAARSSHNMLEIPF
jgi:hypothetical protein